MAMTAIHRIECSASDETHPCSSSTIAVPFSNTKFTAASTFQLCAYKEKATQCKERGLHSSMSTFSGLSNKTISWVEIVIGFRAGFN